MHYLLDTNFISELRKRDRANRGVQAWALANDPALCAVSVMTLGEIRQGVEDVRDDDPAQARSLEAWLQTQITLFGGNVFPVTAAIADRWGRLVSATNLPDVDMLLAATALEHDLTLITRNVEDFKGTGVRVLNPWK
jgi:predicted nucleic acid-binding protein